LNQLTSPWSNAKNHGGGAVTQVDLGEDVVDVRLDGALADDEARGDLRWTTPSDQ